MAREKLGGEIPFPPGVATTFGHPEKASAFIQAKLPGNMTWEHKRSRCVSFCTDNAIVGTKGTTRTKAQAIRSAAAWCWSWYESLDSSERSAVQAAAKTVASSSRGGGCKRGGEQVGEPSSSSTKKSKAKA